ncbi:acyltransferase family protein [Paenibacillus chartarius]|uniref:Acyltransferase family protein n=1 Tax=Paenibacillus chartarius TaxID=747481 RepID=A0ABV6DHU1_9BACL
MSKPSEAFILNVKFVLIAFVVIANVIEPLIDRSGILRWLYQAIFTFHIPMFVFAMGLLAKDFRLDHRGLHSLVEIAWQYVLFQTVYSLMDAALFHADGVVHSFFMPYSLLWFLFSHLCWRAMLPLFIRMKHPIIVAVGLGIAAGFLPVSGAWLSLSRTFVFLPFFLAGYSIRLDRTFQQSLRR